MIRFNIRRTDFSNRGPVYEVTHNETVIIPRTTKPAADGCRALVALGLSGSAEMWNDAMCCMTFQDIERAALLTTTEGEMSGPRITKYVPFSMELRP